MKGKLAGIKKFGGPSNSLIKKPLGGIGGGGIGNKPTTLGMLKNKAMPNMS